MTQNDWVAKLKPFAQPKLTRSIFQIITALVPYFALLTGMYLLMVEVFPYWIVFLISIPAAFFLVRIFIIFHDCVHKSFFKSKLACTIIGHITGTMVFTSYFDWGYSHYVHHGTVSNLDKRGIGDVWMLTVDEYNSMKKGKKLWYKIYRNPVFLFLIIPVVLFIVANRMPKNFKNKKGVWNVIITNIVIAGILVAASLTIGIKYYLAIQLPVMFFASIVGVWLFFIQHNYLEEYWEREKDWDFMKSAMMGSTFYKLPGILRWFTGNIGYHHVHHLKTTIPNYNLKKCYDAIPELREIKPITLFSSFKNMFLKLYDEQSKILVNFTKARKLRAVKI